MIRTSIHHHNFDTTAFETEREQVFERAQKTEQFSNVEIQQTMSNFADGKWDGFQNFEPEPHQLASAAYRKGYLLGVKDRLEAKLAELS